MKKLTETVFHLNDSTGFHFLFAFAFFSFFSFPNLAFVEQITYFATSRGLSGRNYFLNADLNSFRTLFVEKLINLFKDFFSLK